MTWFLVQGHILYIYDLFYGFAFVPFAHKINMNGDILDVSFISVF